jgi:hypothetical protein
MFSPPSQLRFTATPNSDGSGASQGMKGPHSQSNRPRHFTRRRNTSSMGGVEHSTSPAAANPPIQPTKAPGGIFDFVPQHAKASHADTSRAVPGNCSNGTGVRFHALAKENDSPRSNSGVHGAASRAPGGASQACAPQVPSVPVPTDDINAACEHRNRGNALFKQKKYPEAEYAYSAALKSLLAHKQKSPGDVKARQIAVFYSNRAAAKLMQVCSPTNCYLYPSLSQHAITSERLLWCQDSSPPFPAQFLIVRFFGMTHWNLQARK